MDNKSGRMPEKFAIFWMANKNVWVYLLMRRNIQKNQRHNLWSINIFFFCFLVMHPNGNHRLRPQYVHGIERVLFFLQYFNNTDAITYQRKKISIIIWFFFFNFFFQALIVTLWRERKIFVNFFSIFHRVGKCDFGFNIEKKIDYIRC